MKVELMKSKRDTKLLQPLFVRSRRNKSFDVLQKMLKGEQMSPIPNIRKQQHEVVSWKVI